MAVEYERKFKAEPALLDAVDRAYPGKDQQIQMETTYYDTPTGAFSAMHYTLRRRLENGVSVCALKAPAGSARGEWELESDSIEDAIPGLLSMGCPTDVGELAREGLVPICGAKFNRIAKTVVLEDGVVELALDKGVLTGGGKQIPLCEIEVELKVGAASVCDHFAQELAETFALKPEQKSKFRRALDLYRGE